VDCIIYTERNLDISTLEKIRNFFYHWAVLSEGDPFSGLESALLCDGGKETS
jgi:hypothetical protein